MDLLLLCFQHVVLFYHILLQLDAFTPYKDLLLQQLMLDSAEVTAAGMEGAKYNKNLDNSDLLSLLQGTGQYTLKTLRQEHGGTTFCFTEFLPVVKEAGFFLSHMHTYRNPSTTWFLTLDVPPYRDISNACYSQKGFRPSGAFDCSETNESYRFVSGNVDGKRFPSRDLT